MASIKGIELKNVKTFRGVEYPTCYQGTLYYNGKKMGFWSHDSWGGPNHYEFNTSELDKIAKEYYGEESYYDLDCLIDEVLNLREYEKTFKKNVKNGYDSTVVCTDGFREIVVRVPRTTDKEKAQKEAHPYTFDFTNKSPYKDKVKTYVFTSLEDFNQ